MEVKFSKEFEKDLAKVADKKVVLKVEDIIGQLTADDTLENIRNLKPLKGHKNCYRIRIGSYRLGILLQGKIVWLARIMTRKDIYRFFP